MGDVVPIVATLVTRDGTIRGATIVAAVENLGGTGVVVLRDDGQHNSKQFLYPPNNTSTIISGHVITYWFPTK
jgi:hypothetical protein